MLTRKLEWFNRHHFHKPHKLVIQLRALKLIKSRPNSLTYGVMRHINVYYISSEVKRQKAVAAIFMSFVSSNEIRAFRFAAMLVAISILETS